MSPLDRLSLNQLRVLLTLLDTSSVTAAARRLGITQPAASHALRALREVLDDPLLVASGAGMVRTPRAEAIHGPLRRLLHDLHRTLAAPADFDPASARRTFVVATWDGITVTLLPSLLARLRAEAPGIDLDVVPLPEAGAAEGLAGARFDLATEVRPRDAPGLRQRVLQEDAFVCVVRADHPEVGEVLDLDTWLRLPHALISPKGDGRSVVDAVLAERGLTRRIQLRIRYFLAAPLIVSRSDLVLTAPRSLAEGLARLVPLRLLEAPLPLPHFKTHLLWHERSDLDPAHRWLRQVIAEVSRAESAPPQARTTGLAEPLEER